MAAVPSIWKSVRSTNRNPICLASAAMRSDSRTILRSIRIRPSSWSVRLCSRRAFSSCSRLMSPSSTRISPSFLILRVPPSTRRRTCRCSSGRPVHATAPHGRQCLLLVRCETGLQGSPIARHERKGPERHRQTLVPCTSSSARRPRRLSRGRSAERGRTSGAGSRRRSW